MSQILIHGAICPTKLFDEELIRQRAYEDVREKYLDGSFWYKILRYFGEKEIKHHAYKKVKEEISDEVQSNIFSHEERSAYVHRCNIAYHYPLDIKHTSSKTPPSITNSALDEVANEFILGTGTFAGLGIEEAIEKLETQIQSFFSTQDELRDFVKKHGNFPKENIGSDLVEQLKVYKANVLFVQAILDHERTQADVQQLLNDFIERHHELPLAMRTVGIELMDNDVVEKLRDPAHRESFEEILKPIYQVNIQAIPAREPMGVVAKRNMYMGPFARVGKLRKQAPWRAKVLIMIILYGGAAYLGGRAIFALPLIVFIKQYSKTKADLAEATIHKIQSTSQQHQIAFQQKNTLEKVAGGGTGAELQEEKKAKSLLREWYDTIPASLFSSDVPRIEDFILKMTSLLVEPNKTEETKDNLESLLAQALAYLQQGIRNGIPSIATDHPEHKELYYMRFYKTLIVSSSVVGLPLSHAENHGKIKQLSVYIDSSTTYQNDIEEAKRRYGSMTSKYAAIDAIMTAVIVGVTGWLTSLLFNPSAGASTAMAAQTATKIDLDKDSPLWELLEEHEISDSITEHHSVQEVAKIIDTHQDYAIQEQSIVRVGETHIDVNIDGALKDIMPDDIRDELLTRIQEGTTEDTLRDTAVDIAGYTDGNHYVQEMIDELWKADMDGVSELFSSAIDNGLPVDNIEDPEWDHIIRVLNNIYDYEGFEDFAQWIDKERLYERFNDIQDGSLSLEEFGKEYTLEQRSVLSHAAFTQIDGDDLYDLFYDTGDKIVGSLENIELGEDISETTEETVTGTGDSPSWWQSLGDRFNFDFDRGIKSMSLPRGKNRMMPEDTVE